LVFSSFNGEIIKYVEGQLKLFAKVNGQIRGMVYDQAKNCYYLADLLRQSVISLSAIDASETELVNEYEGAPLLGPHSLALSNLTGNVFFTDCGAFGENSPSNAQGSLFVIDMQQQSIRSLALRCLSAPTGLAFGKD
jgi:sugar lactone lactonase YvrE